MGFKDNLVRQKDGSYAIKSKTKENKKEGACIECGENSIVRDLLYRYNSEDVILVREYIEDHLTMHPKHKSITPIWCDTCKALKNYLVKII